MQATLQAHKRAALNDWMLKRGGGRGGAHIHLSPSKRHLLSISSLYLHMRVSVCSLDLHVPAGSSASVLDVAPIEHRLAEFGKNYFATRQSLLTLSGSLPNSKIDVMHINTTPVCTW